MQGGFCIMAAERRSYMSGIHINIISYPCSERKSVFLFISENFVYLFKKRKNLVFRGFYGVFITGQIPETFSGFQQGFPEIPRTKQV